jgi:membrane protein DedA with SNARE-associated domain
MITAWCAAVLGDNVGYCIGRFGGRRLVLRFGRYVLLSEDRLQRGERFFESRGAVVVVIARFIEILRQLNGIIAGIAGMRWWRFLVFNALGAALWVGFWSILFFHLGRQGKRIVFLLRGYEPYAAAILAILVIGIIALRIGLRRRRESPRGPRSRTGSET